jgi:hypothetical protein
MQVETPEALPADYTWGALVDRFMPSHRMLRVSGFAQVRSTVCTSGTD